MLKENVGKITNGCLIMEMKTARQQPPVVISGPDVISLISSFFGKISLKQEKKGGLMYRNISIFVISFTNVHIGFLFTKGSFSVPFLCLQMLSISLNNKLNIYLRKITGWGILFAH